MASIGVFIQDRDMGSIVQEMQERVANEHQAAGGLLHDLGRRVREPAARHEAAGADRAGQRAADFRAAVRGVRQRAAAPLLILLNVPFALIGGIVALWVTGIHLSVSAAIGFIALFGQAVLNGVVMVSYFNELRDAGRAAVRGGARRRAGAACGRC